MNICFKLFFICLVSLLILSPIATSAEKTNKKNWITVGKGVIPAEMAWDQVPIWLKPVLYPITFGKDWGIPKAATFKYEVDSDSLAPILNSHKTSYGSLDNAEYNPQILTEMRSSGNFKVTLGEIVTKMDLHGVPIPDAVTNKVLKWALGSFVLKDFPSKEKADFLNQLITGMGKVKPGDELVLEGATDEAGKMKYSMDLMRDGKSALSIPISEKVPKAFADLITNNQGVPYFDKLASEAVNKIKEADQILAKSNPLPPEAANLLAQQPSKQPTTVSPNPKTSEDGSTLDEKQILEDEQQIVNQIKEKIIKEEGERALEDNKFNGESDEERRSFTRMTSAVIFGYGR